MKYISTDNLTVIGNHPQTELESLITDFSPGDIVSGGSIIVDISSIIIKGGRVFLYCLKLVYWNHHRYLVAFGYFL